MKVITHPTPEQVEEREGTIIVARWKSGSLCAFRYHSYSEAWYAIGEETEWGLNKITKSAVILAVFIDNPDME